MAISASPNEDDNNRSTVDETTALLATTAGEDVAKSYDEPENGELAVKDGDEKPLPRNQIFLLCYARLVEPVAFFSIFPFINKMIWDTGDVEEADVGFYSGLIESLFSLTQMFLMIAWGRAADRLGRKPVLVFSLAGVSITTALFGLSKTIWQMILFRCLAGVFAGTIVTLRAMISENSTPKTQARAFSFFGFTGNLGIFLGPLLGGALADPAGQYPSVFGGVQFFEKYPYALPTFVTGSIGVSATITSALFVKETLDRKGNNKAAADRPMSTEELLKVPGVAIVLGLYGLVLLLALAYTAVVPVFWFTQVKLGGFGFSPLQISLMMGLGGLSQSLWLLLAFPPLQHRFGTGGVLRACSIAWPFFFAFAPVGNVLLRQGWRVAFWVIAPTALVIGSGVCMAFTGVQLALNDIAPSPTTLGTLNALALTLVSGIRAVAPGLFASLYATGVRAQIFYGYLAWVVLVVIGLGYTVAVRWLPKKAEGKLKVDGDSE